MLKAKSLFGILALLILVLPFVNPANTAPGVQFEYCNPTLYSTCDGILGIWKYNLIPAIVSDITLPQPGSSIEILESSVSCIDPQSITIGYYDAANGWTPIAGPTVSLIDTGRKNSQGNPIYKLNVKVTVPGLLKGHAATLAVMEDPETCVYSTCAEGRGALILPRGNPRLNQKINFVVCNATPLCEATKDGTCDRQCLKNLDPDCSGACTNSAGNCCQPSVDGTVDPDCGTFEVTYGSEFKINKGTDHDSNVCIKTPMDQTCCLYGTGCDNNCYTYQDNCAGKTCTQTAGYDPNNPGTINDCCNPGISNTAATSTAELYMQDPDCPVTAIGPCDPLDAKESQEKCIAGFDLDNEYYTITVKAPIPYA